MTGPTSAGAVDLLPCPFCEKPDPHCLKDGVFWKVMCFGCGAALSATTSEQACAGWNTRPSRLPSAASDAGTELLKSCLYACRLQFADYQAQHEAKGTPEAAVKALANGIHVKMIDAVLARTLASPTAPVTEVQRPLGPYSREIADTEEPDDGWQSLHVVVGSLVYVQQSGTQLTFSHDMAARLAVAIVTPTVATHTEPSE